MEDNFYNNFDDNIVKRQQDETSIIPILEGEMGRVD